MLEINDTRLKRACPPRRTGNKFNLKKISELTESFLKVYKKSGFLVSLALIGPAKMRTLNHNYRGIDQTTDVLSFPADKFFKASPENKYLGEIFINTNEVKKVNKYLDIFETAPEPEYLFYFIFVHGLLHLAGYDDKTEKGRLEMIKRGKDFLKKML